MKEIFEQLWNMPAEYLVISIGAMASAPLIIIGLILLYCYCRNLIRRFLLGYNTVCSECAGVGYFKEGFWKDQTRTCSQCKGYGYVKGNK